MGDMAPECAVCGAELVPPQKVVCKGECTLIRRRWRGRRYVASHREEHAARNAAWREKNADYNRQRHARYYRERRRDPVELESPEGDDGWFAEDPPLTELGPTVRQRRR